MADQEAQHSIDKIFKCSVPNRVPDNDQGGGPNGAPGNDHGGGPNGQGGGPSGARGNIRGSWGYARRRVEVLAISANFHVGSITVFDGKRGQILYKHRESQEEKGEEGMVDLVLTGPYKGISATGSFAIEVDIPTSSGEADDHITWEWDGYDQAYAAQVDVPEPVTRTISMSKNPGREVKVTYMVMSSALEATVEVKLRLKDGHSSNIYGKITAFTGDLRVGSVLFSRTQGTAVRFSPRDSPLLPLARSVVAVPVDSLLRIEADLQIETSNNQEVKHLQGPLIFENGLPSQILDVDGDKVEVNIMWYPGFDTAPPGPRHPQEIAYTIGDDVEGFTRFITELRDKLTNDCWEDVLEAHPDPEDYSSTGDHPVLPRQHAEEPARLLHVKLQVAGEETLTTLAIQEYNLQVVGFMNQNGVWYAPKKGGQDGRLPKDQYNPIPLPWGFSYTNILGNFYEMGKVRQKLNYMHLGKTFAMHAVHTLSRYQPSGPLEDSHTREALVGLMLMICESAKMNPFHEIFASDWDKGTTLTSQLIDYAMKWGRMSRMLLRWKGDHYSTWPRTPDLETIGIMNQQNALKVINLVRAAPIDSIRMELLDMSMRANIGVLGTTIVLFDGERDHIIYRHEKQQGEGMMDVLELTARPFTAISRDWYFTIKVDSPTSSGDVIRAFTWEWDGTGVNGTEVDDPEPMIVHTRGNVEPVTFHARMHPVARIFHTGGDVLLSFTYKMVAVR